MFVRINSRLSRSSVMWTFVYQQTLITSLKKLIKISLDQKSQKCPYNNPCSFQGLKHPRYLLLSLSSTLDLSENSLINHLKCCADIQETANLSLCLLPSLKFLFVGRPAGLEVDKYQGGSGWEWPHQPVRGIRPVCHFSKVTICRTMCSGHEL